MHFWKVLFVHGTLGSINFLDAVGARRGAQQCTLCSRALSVRVDVSQLGLTDYWF